MDIVQTNSPRSAAWRRSGGAAGWAELHAWQVSRHSDAAIFRQIYDQVRSAIMTGALRPGTRLPSTRDLAARLAVARASVVSAYEQLLAEGYVVGKVGSGTYISADIPEPMEASAGCRSKRSSEAAEHRPPRPLTPIAGGAHERETLPFAMGCTLVDARTLDALRKIHNRAFRTLDMTHLGYTDPRGLPGLRQTICDYLRAARAVRCEPDQIIVTAGTQHAIDLAIRSLLAPGDEVLVEDPCYPMTHAALVGAGMKLRYAAVDAQGLSVTAAIRAAPRARAVVVTPSHQFPLGVVLSMARRLELLAWARETGSWIIEDDHQSEFRYAGRPLSSLQGLDDAHRVIYVGTLNKVLFPGLRMGYAVVPPGASPAFVDARYRMDRQPPSLSQTVLAEFMREGHFAAHIRRMRLLLRDQRDRLIAELRRHLGADMLFEAPDQGMHFVAYLAQGLSDIEIGRAARRRGVSVRALSPMYRRSPPRSGLLFGFAGHPCSTMAPAVSRLSGALREAARARGLDVA